MENKAIIDYVKAWLSKNELLNDTNLETDYLNPNIEQDEKGNFSLEQKETPNPIIKRNVIGTKVTIQSDFILAGRFSFEINENNKNSENLQKMEKIMKWIITQKNENNYPQLNDGEECIGIDITSAPFLFGVDNSMTYSRYQMQFRITYEKRENK